MWGICGHLRFDGGPVEMGLLKAMADSIRHRGPDGEGFHINGCAGLAHRRLSIIDLTDAASQPMPNEDETLWLVFNGEIYNYIELREELKKSGHRFRSKTDSEVVLHAYEEWGEECLQHFNGMWAFALYDAKDKSLFFSRDRFGIKPFYYIHNGETFTFASEIKAILAVLPQAARANLPCLGRFFTDGIFDDGENTFYADIKQLEPAHCARLKDGKLTIAGYWEFDREEAREKYDFDRPEQTLRELLTDSVRLRLRSDVPVGTCLSGGLDSSTIVSIADKFFSTSINTFSSLYSEDGYDESRFAEIVNNLCKTTPHPVRPKPQGFMDIMKEISWYQDEPTAGPGVYSQWHVMKEAHGVVKVLLDGQGGDELLAGYFPYYHHYAASMWQDVKRRKSLGMLRRFIRENRKIREKYPQHNAIRAFLYPLAPKILRRVYRKLKSMRGPRLKEPDVLNSDFVAMVRKESPPERPRKDLGDPLNTVLHDSLTRSSIPALLHYEDRNSMAFSIEARTPFLDYRVVEFCLALPYDIKMHDGETKYVLRQAMRGVLPDEIVNRHDKMGYPTPMANWFRNEVYDDLRDVVLSRRCIERGIFSRDGLERLISSHKNGRKDANWELYRILATELWFERFIDKQG